MAHEPAFPTGDDPINQGMSLRDYFAAKAMQAFITGSGPDFDDDKLAVRCYEIASAMVKEAGEWR